jgi:thiol-disulfide isomerase/thioredoxin
VSHRSNRPSTSTAPVVIVMFAATWAPASRYFETTYAKLSLKYQSERIRFLIFDIDADPMVGEKYKINTSSSSTELPTVVLYRDGQEKRRLPVRGEGAAARLAWTRTFDSVVNAFELDSLVGATQERGSDKRNA